MCKVRGLIVDTASLKSRKFISGKQIMTLREFNSKSIIEKADILWSWGYFMVKRSQGTKSISLFAVNGFFAELVMSKLDNRVLGINGYSVEEVPLDYFR